MNVVVIMLDSLRFDFLGCGGNSVVKTPYIDQVAREGLILEQAYAEYPITIPSRTAFISGIYTFTNRPWCPLKSYDAHIAEILKENGFTTAAFTDSPFMRGGFDRGFDVFARIPLGKCSNAATDKKYNFPEPYFPPEFSGKRKAKYYNAYSNTMTNRLYAQEKYGKSCPELLFDQAIEWLKKNSKFPFFLWIDSFEPHEPWCPPSPYDTMYQHRRYIPLPAGPDASWMREEDRKDVLSLYMGDITHTDEQVGKVIAGLKKLNLEQDTMLIIISDHGEPFGEHGTILKFGVPLYEELSQIVFIMKKPGLISAGKCTKALVQNVDLAPTILDVLNIKPPVKKKPVLFSKKKVEEKCFEGRSLATLFKNENVSIHNEIYMGAFALHSAVREDQWKFIDYEGEKLNELFDLKNDPKEKVNLIKDKKEVAKYLHYKLWKFKVKWAEALAWRDEPYALGKKVKNIL